VSSYRSVTVAFVVNTLERYDKLRRAYLAEGLSRLPWVFEDELPEWLLDADHACFGLHQLSLVDDPANAGTLVLDADDYGKIVRAMSVMSDAMSHWSGGEEAPS
jgi:hypothetical protein